MEVARSGLWAPGWLNYMIVNIVIFTANCFSALGLDSGEIKDEALTQSFSSGSVKPHFIRLNADVNDYPFGWGPETPSQEYIQVK